MQKRGVLERLDAGEVVVGDGGFNHCLEKRGYVKAGSYTPEATVEHPEAGLNSSKYSPPSSVYMFYLTIILLDRGE